MNEKRAISEKIEHLRSLQLLLIPKPIKCYCHKLTVVKPCSVCMEDIRPTPRNRLVDGE